jgi:HTH-type transcriptional regulator / antitoxin HipB
MFRSAYDVGAAIREKRKALGWIQTELAARSGTGERFIVELESGKPSCQLEKSLIVARIVGIEIGDLRTAQAAAASPDDERDFLPTFDDDDLLRSTPVAHLTPGSEWRLNDGPTLDGASSGFLVSLIISLR